MSPNALQGKAPTETDDIYSVGIIMWQLESGQYPYSSIDCNDTVAYNVVKRGIRPNACRDFSNGEQYSRTNSTSIKSMSYDQVESKHNSSTVQRRFGNSINRNAITPDTRAAKRNFLAVFSADRINRKQPLINVSDDPILLRISKKLKFDEQLSPLKNLSLPEAKGLQHQLNEIFGDKSVKDQTSIGIEYTQTYINCWQENDKARPTTSELFRKLTAMLMTLKEEI